MQQAASERSSTEQQGHDHAATTRGRLLWALGGTLAFSIIEVLAGLRSGSLALLADAGHMVTDGAALGLAAFAAWLAARPPTERHCYGWGRVELLAALVNALAMLAVVFGIGVEAWSRLKSPVPIQGAMVSGVAALGLLINLAVAWLLSGGRSNLNVRAAFIHVLGDLLASVAALVAGGVVWATGWTPIDPMLSLLIGGLVLASSLRLLREAVHGLLDGVPSGISLPELGRAMAATPGVLEIHDLHVWALSAERSALSAHVRVADLADWPRILAELQRLVGERGIDHCTFQPEVPALEHPIRIVRADPAAIPQRDRG
ncbi:MAG TPA: cation diffusion facilitator family transporter [Ramlibacter sp.]|nr:cation diffusion facilitator family transporter [Ramlibacter sp.]